MIIARRVDKQDDLDKLVDQINSASWDDANDMCEYDVAALSDYLDHEGTVFIACHESEESGNRLLGIASARLQIKPYAGERWLYIDEVDVCTDQRCKGVGTAIMQRLFELAREQVCTLVWLGTELDNEAANALYRSLDPDDVEPFTGYCFEIQR